MLSVRQQVLRTMLGEIDERMQMIKRNTSEVEESLYRMLQEALLQLQAQADKKVCESTCARICVMLTSNLWGQTSALAAVQVELQRQVEHMIWMESFLKYEKEVRRRV